MLNIANIRKEWFIEQVDNLKLKGITYSEIAAALNIKPQYLNLIKNTERGVSEKIALKLCDTFNINHNDLLIRISTYKSLEKKSSAVNREFGNATSFQKIPLHEHYSTDDGFNENKAIEDSLCTKTIRRIDTSELFVDATSLVRHFGDSMPEYPSGSILVLKRLKNLELIIWGRNYFIETCDVGFTKRLQDGGKDHVIGYSSNMKTYPDGRFIHEPVKIPKKHILHIHLILGCITKEFNESIVSSATQMI